MIDNVTDFPFHPEGDDYPDPQRQALLDYAAITVDECYRVARAFLARATGRPEDEAPFEITVAYTNAMVQVLNSHRLDTFLAKRFRNLEERLEAIETAVDLLRDSR